MLSIFLPMGVFISMLNHIYSETEFQFGFYEKCSMGRRFLLSNNNTIVSHKGARDTGSCVSVSP